MHNKGSESTQSAQSVTGSITLKHTHNTNTETERHTQSTMAGTTVEVKEPAGLTGGPPGPEESASNQRAGGADGHKSG